MSKKVVIVGSFRKNPKKLKAIHQKLGKLYEVLSPDDIEFINPADDFVRTQQEVDLDVNTIEENHLDAIRRASFVWLFAPDGYVGTSAAFEVGFAHALGVPIYTDSVLNDEMLQSIVTDTVEVESVPSIVHRPGNGIAALQEYYKRAADERGWANESARDTMLLLTEEIGELARAIRKTTNLKRDEGYGDISLMDELADVQLYLVHLANGLNVSLAESVSQKERKNDVRHKTSK
ncbi:MazG protein [Candidatus Saccharibacteria bacterium RAAC3_TM7_1]|nr:MazG protein [Candidatus Saccharibacteria bacterium RAAC3_TM7_1]